MSPLLLSLGGKGQKMFVNHKCLRDDHALVARPPMEFLSSRPPAPISDLASVLSPRRAVSVFTLRDRDK